MLKISAVSYINAKPFVYGIEHSGFLKSYTLSLDIPSRCAEKLKDNSVDIGLAPVAIIPTLKHHFIIPDFCIGSNGPVLTVMLYSEVSLKEIKTVYLDYQSNTSSLLVRILAKYWWKISPEWIQASEGYEKNIKGTTAGLIIGDRNFTLSGKFKYAYDLSNEWKNFTGLPFVFACWIANKELEEDVVIAFYKSLRFGIDSRSTIVKSLSDNYDPLIMDKYLNHSINYSFDKAKQSAMDLFLKLGKKVGNKLPLPVL